MYLKEIWRYPAKSMAGEKLDRIELTNVGLLGDRQILVQAATARILTARTHYKLLGLLKPLVNPAGEHCIWIV